MTPAPAEVRHDEVRRRRSPMASLAVLTVLLLAVAALAGPALLALGTRSSASFGASEELGVNRLGAATLDLVVGARTASIEAPNMAPGDRETGQIELVNRGDLPLRYALVSEADPSPLLAYLRWDVWIPQGPCTSAPQTTALLTGAALSSGRVDVLGDPATGQQPGDRILAPGEREVICVAVEFPADASSSAAAMSLEQQFMALAEHAISDTRSAPAFTATTRPTPYNVEEPTP